MAAYLSIVASAAFYAMLVFVFLVVAGLAGGVLWLVFVCIGWLIGLVVRIDTDERSLNRALAVLYALCVVVMLPLGYSAASAIHSSHNEHKAERIIDRVEIRRYKLADFDPPKHVYVTIRDVKTDQLYESQYVSKHCSFGIKRGEEVNIKVTVWHYDTDPTTQFLSFNDLYSVFCN